MAPGGAPRGPVTPGPDPMALITRLLSSLLLLSMVLPSTSSLPVKTARQSFDGEYYVNPNNIRCRLCPPGTFVKDHCNIRDTWGECEPCPIDTYSESATGMTECLTCGRCRDDQDEVSACKSTQNTKCRCKKGTYCAPNQPCEICTNCTPSCPEDQILLSPCNSTSDIHCGPPSDPSDNTKVIIVSLLVVFLILIIIGLCLYCWKRNSGKESKVMEKILSVCKPTESGDDPAGTQLLTTNLQFREGTDAETKELTIGKTFDIVVDHVPIKAFDRFMRKLGLHPNEIERVKVDHPLDVNSQHYAMLRTWYQQNNCSVNHILNELRNMKMDTAADAITDQLLRDQLYIRQSQH